MRDRDPADFDSFYTATAPRLVHYLYAMLGDLAEAQDIAQEAYARAWQRWPTVAGYDSPEAWVRAVAWRLAVNRWRSLRRRLAAWSRMGAPAPVPGPDPDRVAIAAALRRLPMSQRRVLVLHYLYELRVADIAAATAMPEGTVKVYLRRGRAALAGALGLDDKEESDVITHA